jgi:hypothetical protein
VLAAASSCSASPSLLLNRSLNRLVVVDDDDGSMILDGVVGSTDGTAFSSYDRFVLLRDGVKADFSVDGSVFVVTVAVAVVTVAGLSIAVIVNPILLLCLLGSKSFSAKS